MASLGRDLRTALDPAQLMPAWGLTPDPWQTVVLQTRPARALLLCCRQAGKSSTAAASCVHEAVYRPGSLCLMIAPSQRQSSELLRKARSLLARMPATAAITGESTHAIELANGSRIVSLPAREDTIRGYSSVSLLVIDEAAWVDDDLYYAVRPMLAVSKGRLLALSTPNGQRGWFHNAWTSQEQWQRIQITAADCPRISPAFLAEERRTMTPDRYASEYECQFTDAIDSVFHTADIQAALDPDLTPLYPGGPR